MRFIFKALAFGLLVNSTNVVAEQLNIYSFREARLIKPLIDRFSDSTGIKVNIVSGKADKLMDRLIADGDNSFADLVLTTNVARLERAKSLGLLQPVNSNFLNQHVPGELKDDDDYWYGISMRARAIFYARENEEASKNNSYRDIVENKWRGKVCSRKGSHIYNRAMVASFVYRHGEQWTREWAKGLVNNLAMRPNGGDRDQLRNIKKGNCDIALANSYYFGMMSQSPKQQDREVYKALGVIWPDQESFGTHVNISGAAVTSAAKNKANAVAFIEFLVTKEAQAIYSEINHELPIRSDMSPGELLNSWGHFKVDKQAIKNLNQYLPIADKIIAESGW